MRRAVATRLVPSLALVITEVVRRHTVAYRYREPIIGHRSRAPKHILLTSPWRADSLHRPGVRDKRGGLLPECGKSEPFCYRLFCTIHTPLEVGLLLTANLQAWQGIPVLYNCKPPVRKTRTVARQWDGERPRWTAAGSALQPHFAAAERKQHGDVVCKDPFAVHADPKVGIILLPILQRPHALPDLRVPGRRVLT